VDNKMHPLLKNSKRKTPHKSAFIVMLIITLGISVVLCRCSHTVDILMPDPGEQGVSAQGTCVACHNSAKMIDLTASPIEAPPAGGEG
jgi:hypothetical protein